MNRRPPVPKLSQAIVGFQQHKAAEALSPRTLVSYEQHLKNFLEHVGDLGVSQLKSADIRGYLAWLRADYQPQRFTGSQAPLSPKTIRNFWVSLSAFFSWISRELELPNPMKNVPGPRFEDAPVEPFSKEDIEVLLKACDFCQQADTTDRRRFTMRRVTGKRDRALILTLLDTGLRASELCALKMGDLEQKTGRLQVKHGRAGGAKGGKGRTVFLGKAARRALWLYLTTREEAEDAEAPLFIGRFNRPLNRDTLRQVIASLGEKAGVKNCHPHRFRHTFAINFLRNGGNVFALQRILGHESLEMVKRYLSLAQMDLDKAHQDASPVANWLL